MKTLSRAAFAALLLLGCGPLEKDPYPFRVEKFVIDKAPSSVGEEIAFEMEGRFDRGELLQGDAIVYRFIGRIEEPAVQFPDGTAVHSSALRRFRTVSLDLPRLRAYGGDEGQVAEVTATVGEVETAPAPSKRIPCSVASGAPRRLVIKNLTEDDAFYVNHRDVNCKVHQPFGLVIPGDVVPFDTYVGAGWGLRNRQDELFQIFVIPEGEGDYVVEVTTTAAED